MTAVRDYLRAVVARLVDLYRAYPARATSYIVAVIVAVAGILGVGIDSGRLAEILGVALPILIGGEVVHRRVSPVDPPRRG